MIRVSEVRDESMFLVLPVPFREFEGKIQVEAQAANGLDRWADNFKSIVVAAPLMPSASTMNLSGFVWRDLSSLEHANRIIYQPLPLIRSTSSFLKSLKSTRAIFSGLISKSQHLQFALSGIVGDWGAVAALEAIKLKRRFAIHTDCVEHELIKRTSCDASSLRRMRVFVESSVMKRYHRHIIRHASLGLWHGDERYRAFSPWCAESHLVHDIHTKASDLINGASLDEKLKDVLDAKELRIIYAGRFHPMKAPLEWLSAVAAARDSGAQLKATWYGEGPLLEAAKAERSRLGLEDIVDFAGFVADRGTLLNHVRSAHAVLFTHVTPESPRNLLEALVSGTPIIGYDNPYAQNLIESEGGGALVPMHDARRLGELVAHFATHREELAGLIREAASNGRRFNDAAVFEERSELVKQFA